MLCSKCGRKIPEGQEVSRDSFTSGGSTWSRGGIMCKKCAFPSFWKRWGWLIIVLIIFFVLGVVSYVGMRFERGW